MNRILFLLLFLLFVGIGERSYAVATSEVHMNAVATSAVRINDNITATAYSNGINLKCSFTLEIGELFFAIALTAQNGTSDTFKEIAGFSKINSKPQLIGFGMDLFGNETTFEESQNAFMLTFNNLTCRHERQYKCFLYVSTIDILPKLIKSDTMWISVTVFPSKPEIHSPQKVNDFSNAKRNTRSATLAPSTYEKKFFEGDNITFLCGGDVGRPEGRFVWQKINSSDGKFNYSDISTKTIPVSCSFDGNSTLTIQVTGDDNQARIRCIVKSELPNGTRHVDSEPLRIQFKVRTPFIALFPNKTVFQEGDSVQLNCKANGNPNPSYSWTKGNSSKEIIVYNDILLINDANISDSGLYTCDTRNVVDGTVYSEYVSTYINIANNSKNPYRTTSRPSRSDNKKVVIVVGTVCGFIILALCVILFSVIHNKYIKSDDRSPDYVNTTQQQQLSLYEGVGHTLDVHNYEQMTRMEHLYNNTNLSSN